MAEPSADLAARIESLKASHAENPARFFMPLASAYREAGEVGRAEELLRENLKRHPGYLSAHVLLGRCLADRGALAEARNEFQYVLSVDPQNLIALRTLGDMAAAQGQTGEARRWYGELLVVDPMNAEARQALSALDAHPAAPAVEPGPAPSPAAASGPEPAHEFGAVDLDGPAAPPAGPAQPADAAEWGEVRLDEEPRPAEGAPDAAAPWGEVTLAEPLGGGTPREAEEDRPAGAGFDALDFGTVDFSAADAGPPGRESPAAPSGVDAWGSLDDGQLGAAPAERLEGLGGFFEEEEEPAPEEEHHDEGEVVTETMAELYARQGFLDRAADVYRELVRRRGREPALVRRLEELEAQMQAGGAEAAVGEGFGAAPAAAARDEEPREEGPPSWLETVDAVASGAVPASTLPDVGLEPGLPDLDLASDLHASPAVEREEAAAAADFAGATDFAATLSPEPAPEPAFAAAGAGAEAGGDAFADSFAGGFGDAEGAPSTAGAGPSAVAEEPEQVEWEAPRAEETEPAAALAAAPEQETDTDTETVGAAAEATGDGSPAVEEPAAAPAEAAPAAGATIRHYMAEILSWRPGAAAAPPAPPAEAAPPTEAAPPAEAARYAEAADTTESGEFAPPAEQPWDRQTLEAAEAQPPLEEPWIAAGPPVEPVEEPRAEEEPWRAPAPESAAEEEEPWAAAPVGDGSPALGAADEAAEGGEEDLPWIVPEPAAPERPEGFEAMDHGRPAGPPPLEGPREDELMPWETPFELAGEAAQAPTTERPAPRDEPTAQEAGGFSFEDFFAERPAAEASARPPQPVTLPEPPAPPAAAAPPPPPAPAAEEDEDLESFQAWLQSLKR
ncbi:MAG TPA: tetratricopeptide repeat protein [Longimicrobium sp.]|jgi:tetratricopeptide (TPR) repeat protein